ncbi:MAG: carboxypeptidase regulatory-like domain-containing protein [Deltaproteobacteria bacterium]|nr:carboxypeptidase regulatory-like domain-containing protein [Deltaproteobacteria bacterium]
MQNFCNRKRALVLVVAALGLWPLAALAQTTGTISGTVWDQTGTPVAGVTVSIESPTQIGGKQTAVSDSGGRFRFSALTPGMFSLVATAPKLRKLVQPGIRVSQGRIIELDLIVEVETGSDPEEFVIEQKAPLVNTNSTGVGESYDAEFLDKLPLTTRDYQGVAALTPGAVDREGSGNPQVRGGTYFNNSYKVDGFETTDPVTHTFGQNFSFDAMSQVEVKTASFGAENSSTSGGIVNIVTKSGSNRLEVDGTATYTDDHLRFFTDNLDRGNNRLATVSLNVGGPIQKDRIWFYVSGQMTNVTSSNVVDTSGQLPDHPPYSVLAFDGLAKVTWQVNPRNKLEWKNTYSVGDFRNVLQSPFVEPEAEARQFQRTYFSGLSWNAVLTDNLVAVARAGFQQIFFDVGPQSCLWDPNCSNVAGEFDLSSGVSRRNFTSQTRDSRRTGELSGEVTYFKNTATWGSHGLKLGWKYFAMSNQFARTVPGDQVLGFFGQQPFFRTETCVNDPRDESGACRSAWLRSQIGSDSLLLHLSDQYKPTRYITITPGLAFHNSSSADDQDRNVTDISAITPHLSVAWDPTHDGRTVLRASYNSYVDTGFLALARFTSRQLTQKTCFYDMDIGGFVGNCRISGGFESTTVGLPCGPDGTNPDGTSCRTKLNAPRTHEITMGAEREVVTGIVAKADFVYRKYNHQWEDLETNAIWNQGGTAVRRDGGYKNGRSQFVFDLETPSEARRRYVGVSLGMLKREGLLKMLASYTWSRDEGVANEDYITNFLDNPGQKAFYYGPLPSDIRHVARLLASYQVLPWLSVGGVYEFQSGPPYNRFSVDPVYGSLSRFTAKRGYDSRGNLNPDDDIPLRLPNLMTIDFQARASLRSLVGQNIDVFFDMLNLMGLRTPLLVSQNDNQFFGQTVLRNPPLRARLGLRYRF